MFCSSPCLWLCPYRLKEMPTPGPHCSCSSEVLTGSLVKYEDGQKKKPFIMAQSCNSSSAHFREHTLLWVPVLRPWMGNVAWARKFWSLNMSISYTTKRRKANAELHTVNWNVFRGHVGFRPLSAGKDKKKKMVRKRCELYNMNQLLAFLH